jgi:hypothetical protein
MKLRHAAAATLTILLVAGNAFAFTGEQYLLQATYRRLRRARLP